MNDVESNCKQLDYQYKKIIKPTKSKHTFTSRDDEIICLATKEGYGWSFIGKYLLPGRLRHVIKQRYDLLNPGVLRVKRNLNKEKEWIAKNKI